MAALLALPGAAFAETSDQDNDPAAAVPRSFELMGTTVCLASAPAEQACDIRLGARTPDANTHRWLGMTVCTGPVAPGTRCELDLYGALERLKRVALLGNATDTNRLSAQAAPAGATAAAAN